MDKVGKAPVLLPGVMITEGSYADVEPYQRAARKDHVSVRDYRDGRWALAHLDDQLAGFGCLWAGVGRGMRLSGTYVFPEHRGHGVASALVAKRVEWARQVGAPYVDTRLYRQAGPFASWEITRSWPSGILEARLSLR